MSGRPSHRGGSSSSVGVSVQSVASPRSGGQRLHLTWILITPENYTHRIIRLYLER